MTPRRPPIPAWDELPGPTPDIQSRLEALRGPVPAGEGNGAPTDRAAAIRAGQAAARARGVRFGRPPLYGDQVAELVRRRSAEGASLRQLAAEFRMTVGSVRRLLSRPVTEARATE